MPQFLIRINHSNLCSTVYRYNVTFDLPYFKIPYLYLSFRFQNMIYLCLAYFIISHGVTDVPNQEEKYIKYSFLYAFSIIFFSFSLGMFFTIVYRHSFIHRVSVHFLNTEILKYILWLFIVYWFSFMLVYYFFWII
jgi:hypothetical protein